ncbi:DUF1847 domain-containing protein [Geomonas subterranea]|uniref:DUF1847 domain-containing protein n=1 Tax=Geomonas subterranea TaxID=2847989 RepID=A0ABX8LIW6_9BACT|nr:MULTISPECIES: DUF1847 domain-containing protein [Geomonas]QXE91414.1 DUF1847 domain-containing protein [Geomonas subterranea]QXM10498.1 DUF1847 domain-containing protein [Geomonas subterranea]
MSKKNGVKSCSDCGTLNCYKLNASFPTGCLTVGLDQEELTEAVELYKNDPLVSKISCSAAEVEGTYYGQLTRVEEIAAFARRAGVTKIGIASCVGLAAEARTFAKFLESQGIASYSVLCKVGAVEKTETGIPKEHKIDPDAHESMCNPVLQARLLAKQDTELNVVVGLCVGHDSLFIKYSQAPVTYLVVKDRVLAHNPVGALYTGGTYYKKLFDGKLR